MRGRLLFTCRLPVTVWPVTDVATAGCPAASEEE